MADIAIIIEGGLVRGAYIDGAYVVEPVVFDFDLEGRDVEELQALLDEIDEAPTGSQLQTDLSTYVNGVQRALSYGDGLGA